MTTLPPIARSLSRGPDADAKERSAHEIGFRSDLKRLGTETIEWLTWVIASDELGENEDRCRDVWVKGLSELRAVCGAVWWAARWWFFVDVLCKFSSYFMFVCWSKLNVLLHDVVVYIEYIFCRLACHQEPVSSHCLLCLAYWMWLWILWKHIHMKFIATRKVRFIFYIKYIPPQHKNTLVCMHIGAGCERYPWLRETAVLRCDSRPAFDQPSGKETRGALCDSTCIARRRLSVCLVYPWERSMHEGVRVRA